MIEPDLVLEYEIEQGRSPDLEKVAHSLLAWNAAVQAAITAIDPRAQVVVELAGVEHGSQRFKQVLRFLEDISENVEEGGKEYPLIFKHAKALAKLLGGGILLAVIINQIIPDEQLETLEEIRELLEKDPDVQRQSEEFFDTLQNEPAIVKIELFEGESEKPIYSVPRSEFAHKSGFFKFDAAEPVEDRTEERIATWDVVLIKPVLVGKARRWTFARDGIEFSATMDDKAVLQAIREKTISLPFAEGVMMKVEIVYKEQLDGEVWRAIAKTRSIRRVLSPRITLPPGALFANAD
jgi:hypothetical protein